MSKTHQYKMTNDSDCPCQSGLSFQKCCQRFLDKSSEQYPETAEQLMRSRYCAFVLKDMDYILNSWHPDFRPNRVELSGSDNHWIGLKIKSAQRGQKDDVTGKVHFIARFKINGKAHKLEENSFFEKINSRWCYVKGDISENVLNSGNTKKR
ncbi:MAG: SEC-C domain-containing protein [gamma proteobacterium symbiont of Bathyaustriella thionipta]|nr:SEC-C domain-containing protein [gamma proteobacterium symbiont of Bathyaustriella thionipta]MCU7949438.1 SEC-C domain-containing protein [gamma proteobacterium symbiont of Bathyaustriella thionipta]MCU7954040.1 SEC-C domain-containing protein [gamma proteobacterium symbiont of Bathyaustriella thionipta]MCU7956025.1 SEC-C domain-containing protein [gamma proteobacterium symbiont of Bathyaustriella thionipta]MCU7966227.1 SEC-C domain-containing protein [gamma proteobacterium symbiont of Bathy